MKNRKTQKSSYSRSGKAPFQYSTIYQNLRRAIKDGQEVLANQYRAQHAKAFGYVWPVKKASYHEAL